MSEHTDPEAADPMVGSGIVEDDYSETSWADDSPWDDPEADQYEEDVRRDGTGEKRKGEKSYDQKLGGRVGETGETELDELARSIRRLEDAEGFHTAYRLSGDRDLLDQDEQQPEGIQVSRSMPSKSLTAEEWVALDVGDDRLDELFPWETEARIDQTGAPPLGMSKRWEMTCCWVELLWRTLRSSKYEEHELTMAESDAIYAITLRVVENEIPSTETENAVTLGLKRVFGGERRGGPRERRTPGKAKRCYPHGHLSGDSHYFDFTTRQHGKGGAHWDAQAAKEWLAGQLVEDDGRRWLIEGELGPFTLEDYKRALAPGRKQMEAAYRELATRARELKEDGCHMTTIAGVLGVSVRTIRRLVK